MNAGLCRVVDVDRQGSGHRRCHPEQVLALKRFSWFSIEFGLIEEAGEVKVFGAGILSSTGEIPFALSNQVKHRPFITDESHRHRL